MLRIIDQTRRRALEETEETFSSSPSTENMLQGSGVFLARVGDLARSNAFLWTIASLQAQERYYRTAPVGLTWSRMSVLTTVAADVVIGYTSLRERARWWPTLVNARDWRLQHQRSANRLLDTAATLGGALIKACQFASTRPDLLPSAYIRTLSRLQDRMPPHPWTEIEATISQELGRQPHTVFASIEQEPIAAASIAQVHRARLLDGREVAVKVQYQEIANLVTVDLTVMESLVAAIAQLAPTIQLQPVLDYLKGTLPLELDFRREAAAMRDLRAVLRHRTDVLIPEVIEELSTGRLLVMEFAEGIKITDRETMQARGISPHEVAQLLNDVYAEQMLRLGVLHADPHPGNLLVQPGPRLVLLDHGLTVQLKPTLMSALGEMVRALTAADFDALNKALVAAGLKLEAGVDVGTLLQLVGVLLGSEGSDDVVEVGTQLSKSFGHIPIDLLLVGRALGLLDGITKQLDQELDTLEIVARYI